MGKEKDRIGGDGFSVGVQDESRQTGLPKKVISRGRGLDTPCERQKENKVKGGGGPKAYDLKRGKGDKKMWHNASKRGTSRHLPEEAIGVLLTKRAGRTIPETRPFLKKIV